MFLTRLRLDAQSGLARRDLANPYDMHRTFMRVFSREGEPVAERVLWRIEPGGAWSRPVVLVQSAAAADWSELAASGGYLAQREPFETKLFEVSGLVEAQAVRRFRLVANPIVSRGGKRHGLVGEESQCDWLCRQGGGAGFDLEAALVTGSDTVHCRKGAHRITLLQVCFEGVLRVRDSVALARAVETGIGHGKAFGCGLLSLARVP